MYLCRRSHCARSYCKYQQLLNSTVSAIAVTVAVVAATTAAPIYLLEEGCLPCLGTEASYGRGRGVGKGWRRVTSSVPSTITVQEAISFPTLLTLLFFLFLSSSLSPSLSSSFSVRCFVVQLYGNCSLTNRLNPLFSLRGEDNHPADETHGNESFDLTSFVDRSSHPPSAPLFQAKFPPSVTFRFTLRISLLCELLTEAVESTFDA